MTLGVLKEHKEDRYRFNFGYENIFFVFKCNCKMYICASGFLAKSLISSKLLHITYNFCYDAK